MNKIYTALFLSVIILVAFFIRIYDLGNNPPGFFADEASIGHNAYALLNYGKDEHGKAFPLFFEAFGEYKNPFQIYLTVPFIFLFGPSVFAVRVTSVFLSLLTIISIYFLTKELCKKIESPKITGLLAAALLSIAPWHIHFSRVSLEGFMPFLLAVTLGTYFFLRFKENDKFLYLATILFSLGLYTYFPARIFIPFFFLGLILIYLKDLAKKRKLLLANFFLGIILTLPILFFLIFGNGLARWNQVSIFNNPSSENSVYTHIAINYFSHFSPDFLFTKGDSGMEGQFVTRHSVKGFGQLFIIELPFIFLGGYWLFRKKQKKPLAVLLIWLLLYPTGSMFTSDASAQATRSIIGIIPFQVLTAIGILYTFVAIKLHHKILSLIFSICIFIFFGISTVSYLKSYFWDYKSYAADFWGWQYGASEIIYYFNSSQNNYDELVMTPSFNAPSIFLKFFAPISCEKCIVGLPETDLDKSKKQLFAVPGDYPQKHPEYNFKIIRIVNYPNNEVAFLIGEIVE